MWEDHRVKDVNVGVLYIKLLVCTRVNIYSMYCAEIFPENGDRIFL
jgi:hypothetical protein